MLQDLKSLVLIALDRRLLLEWGLRLWLPYIQELHSQNALDFVFLLTIYYLMTIKFDLNPFFGSDEFIVKDTLSFLPSNNLEIGLFAGYVNVRILSPPKVSSCFIE